MSKKSNLDQYYTDPQLASHLSRMIQKVYGYDQTYVEPSAGYGAFSKCFHEIISLDIDPKFDGCLQQDFLKVTNKEVPQGSIFVGNPPFGFSGTMAIQFIDKCCELKAKSICFILPRTFEKIFFQNKLNRNLHLVHQESIPKNSFLFEGQSYDVPCVFQAWEFSSILQRPLVEEGENTFFKLVDKSEADLAVRRVGGCAGKVLQGLDHSKSSTYFMRSLCEGLDSKLERLYPYLQVEAQKTAGVKSISTKELVYFLNKQEGNIV